MDYKILLILFVFSGCAWNIHQDDITKLKKEKDLVEEFSNKQEILDKFKEDPNFSEESNIVTEIVKKETDKEDDKPEEEEEDEDEAYDRTSVPKVVREEPKKFEAPKEKRKKTPKVAEKKVAPKPAAKSIDLKKIEAKSIKTRYPKGYPKVLKGYDKKSEPLWKKFSPKIYIGEKMALDVKYFNITAGKIFIETLPIKKIGGRKTFHFFARLKSAPFYEYIYKLDDYIESFMDIETYTPIKYALVQHETKQDVDDLQLFDDEALKTYFWYKRKKNGQIKEVNKSAFIPKYFQDSVTPLFFMRGLPFKIGAKYEFPVITRAKLWIVKIEVVKIETIRIMGERIKAYKLKAETRYPGVLSKKGDIIFWFSKDARKRFLKFEAKVKIGTITGELVSFSK
ncbi:MAG: DUF3108 domain-containing protein [Bacteriovoracaceae bacterium]|jgi:hypothetical protein|nr:DUF3108 domain-containing protein [Bacteriovoracaceae bacterium]